MVRERTPGFLEALNYYETPDLRIDLRKYGDALRRIILRVYLRRVNLYSDVIPCLTLLQAEGFRLGLLSNGPSFICEAALDRFGLRRFFDYSSSTWALKSFKPEAKIFLHMTNQLGVEAERTLIVGDSLDRDIQGAKNIGALSAYLVREHNVPRNQDALHPVPDIILRDLSELPLIVRRVTLWARIKYVLKPILDVFQMTN